MEIIASILAFICTITLALVIFILSILIYVVITICAVLLVVLTPQVLGFIIMFMCIFGIVKLLKRIF